MAETSILRTCCKCNRPQLLDEFYLNRNGHPMGKCKTCCRARFRENRGYGKGHRQIIVTDAGRLPVVPGVEFRLIPEYSGYCAGSDGSVWVLHTTSPFYWQYIPGHLRRVWISGKGYGDSSYWAVTIKKDRSQRGRPVRVHRLVAAAFIGPCPRGLQVRHLDGDSLNNHIENLEYGTAQENADDKKRYLRPRKVKQQIR